MKILLIGAGGQGAPCASILAHDKDIEKIILGDISYEVAKKVAEKINNSKIHPISLNAGNVAQIVEVAKGVDAIIDLISTDFTLNIMEAALAAGVHYINSAFSRGIWDFKLEIGKPPKLYEEFKAKNLTALLGCGMSAGYTNVLVRYYADKMDTLESVKIRLAKKDTSLNGIEEILQPWNPGWNPRIAFMDFVNSTTIFEDGEFKTYETPFSKMEEWEFPEPVGKMEVALHAHEEPYSMPTVFADKGMTYCDFKYYVNKQVAPMVALGFSDKKDIEVKGQKINSLDALLELVCKPSDVVLEDAPDSFEYKDKTKHVAIMIELEGKENGERRVYSLYIPDMNKPREKIYKLFGTTQINVALPTVIGMKMAVEGTKKGTIFSEELDPNRFLELLHLTGFPGRWEEIKK